MGDIVEVEVPLETFNPESMPLSSSTLDEVVLPAAVRDAVAPAVVVVADSEAGSGMHASTSQRTIILSPPMSFNGFAMSLTSPLARTVR